MAAREFVRSLSCPGASEEQLTGSSDHIGKPNLPTTIRPIWKYIVGLATIICIVVLVGALVFTNIHSSEGFPQFVGGRICVPCIELGLDSNAGLPSKTDLRKTSKRHRDNRRHRDASHTDSDQAENICCVSKSGGNPGAYASFFSQEAKEEQFKAHGNVRCDYKSASAHLFLNKSSLSGGLLRWTTNTWSTGNTGHINGPILHEEWTGSLQIMQAGVYNVYGQITFRQDPPDFGGQNQDQSATAIVPATMFTHCLYRKRITSDKGKMLLCTQMTKMNVAPGVRTMQPSHFQAALSFSRGDKLYVKVSNISAVLKSTTDNFFGVYRV